MRLRLFGGTSRQAIDELKSGAIDFAVAAVPGGGFRALKETRLCPLRDVFVASSAFGQLRGRDVPLDEVMRHPFICHKQGSLTFEFLEVAAREALAAGEVFALRLAEELPSRSISLLEYDGHTLSLAARRLRDMLTEDAAAGDAL